MLMECSVAQAIPALHCQTRSEIIQTDPFGRKPDIGGPQLYTSGELARICLSQRRMRCALIPIFLSGKTASALRRGGNTCPQQAIGNVRWEVWFQQRYRRPP
jgi:hypothetical protein